MTSKSSKYDFVKVSVLLGEYKYVLSRFIVSRTLNVIKVKPSEAVKIALELKKKFVDAGTLQIHQDVLEKELFALLQSHDYGDQYITRFRMMSRFHHERVPLLILLAGTGITGKSTVATKLAENLNITNILSTEMLHSLMRIMAAQPSKGGSIWQEVEKRKLVERYKQEARDVRTALQGDIDKCFVEGKSVIIEGLHIDPSLFLDLSLLDLVAPPDARNTDPEVVKSIQGKKKGLILPVVIYQEPEDHFTFLEHWLANTSDTELVQQDSTQLIKKIKWVQDYLFEQCEAIPSTGLKFNKIMLTLGDIGDTTGRIQSVVLNAIEAAYSSGAF